MKTNTPIKDLGRLLTKEDMLMENKCMKDAKKVFLVTGELQIKTTMRFYHTALGLAK